MAPPVRHGRSSGSAPRSPYTLDLADSPEREPTADDARMIRNAARATYRFAQNANRPEDVVENWDMANLYKKPDLSPFDVRPDTDPNNFVKEFEQRFFINQGQVPMPWLLRQDPEDLALLTPEVSSRVYYMQQAAAYKLAEDQARQEEIDAEILATARSRSWTQGSARSSMDWWGAVPGDQSPRVADDWVADAVPLEEQEQIRQRVLTRLEGYEAPATADSELGDALYDFFGTVLKGVGVGVGLVAAGIGQFTGLNSVGPALHTVNAFGIRDRAEAATQAERDRLEQLRDIPRDFWVDKAATETAEEAWRLMDTENPEQKQQFIAMGGTDIVGFALFADAWANDITVQDQLNGMLGNPSQGFADDLKDFEDTLDENDYRTSNGVLDAISFLGKYPMHWATGAFILASDPEMRSSVATGKWDNLWEEVARHDGSPASVFNIDGTIAGLGLDLAAGIAFDPTTWLFGPTGLSMAGRAATKAGVRMTMAGAGMKRFIQDNVRIAFSDSHGLAPLSMTLSTLDEVGMMGDALHILQAVDKTLPAQPWLQLDARAPHALNMATDNVLRMLDPEDVAKLDNLDPVLVERTIARTRESGIDSVVEATYAVSDGTIHINPKDLLRIRASRDAGLRGVPLTVRLSNTLKRVVADPERTAMAADIRANPELYAFHGSNRVTRETVDAALRGESDIVGGVALRRNRAEEFAQGRDGGLQMPVPEGAEDWVLVYRRDSFPEQLQQRFAEGRDLEESYRMVDSTPEQQAFLGERSHFYDEGTVPRPVFAYRVSEGLDGVAVGPQGVPIGGLSKKSLPAAMPTDAPNVNGQFYVRPDRVFDREFTLGTTAVEAEAKMRSLYETAMLRGATPPAATRWATASAWSERLRDAASRSDFLDNVERFVSPQHTISHFDLRGPGSIQKVTETTVRLWGRNTDQVEHWLGRIYEYQRTVASRTARYHEDLADLTVQMKQLRALEDMQGGGWDDSFRLLEERLVDDTDNAARMEWDQARTNRRQLQEDVANRSSFLSNEMARIDATWRNSLPDVRELATIMDDMWADFNRREIAPRWMKEKRPDGQPVVNPETGVADWDFLRRGLLDKSETVQAGRTFLSDEMVTAGAALGSPEGFYKNLSNINSEMMSWNAPLSPLDMIVASSRSGAGWTKYTHNQFVSAVRDLTHLTQEIWILDKVMSPGTAARVSLDEITRIFHRYGREGALEYFKTRADLNASRAVGLLQRGNRFGRNNVSMGARRRSPAAVERLNALKNEPLTLVSAERQAYEQIGMGWDDIDPNDPIYQDAAPRWAANLTQDSGFRAMIRGEDAFREWFYGADGARMRSATVIKDGTAQLLTSWRDAYQGWSTFFDTVVLNHARKNGTMTEVRDAWVQTVRKIDETGGTPHDVPDLVLENLGTIRGVRKHGPPQAGVGALARRLSDSWMEKMFMNPVNFRRGLLGKMARETEMARLRQLMADQNKAVVTDLELMNRLAMQGMPMRTGFKEFVYQEALNQGLVPEGYLSQLAESRAMAEIDNILYTWDQGSRLGNQSRTLFPFGRPWADMAGFWGREFMSRPALRGYINDINFLNVNKIANYAADHMINPKPAMTISRLAATDFSLERPLGGDEKNSDVELDFGPLVFLPTGGDNPFGALLPGLGFIPMAILDLIIKHKYDPVEEPVEYRRLVESVADWIPASGYGTGGNPIPGGVTGTLGGLLLDAYGAVSGTSRLNVGRFIGDISREIARARQLSVLLADEETLNDLMAISSTEELEVELAALITQANRAASGAHASNALTRFLTPVRGNYGEAEAELQEVWLDAGATFPDLQGSMTDPQNDDDRRRASNDIRTNFFDLPQWRRDLYIAMRPALAVNMIASWDWSATGRVAMGREGLLPYRTGGTEEARSKHQSLLDSGYIEPVAPEVRLYRILGLMESSRVNAAKRIYEFTAQDMNNNIWEFDVTPETKAYLEQVVGSQFARDHGYTSARQLWDNWSRAEADMELLSAHQEGIEIAAYSEDLDELKEAIGGIPADEKPWGTSWVGTTEMAGSEKFWDLQMTYFTEEVQELADGLGIELEVGMSGLELLRSVQEEITTHQGAVFDLSMAPYRDYTHDRSNVAREAENTLRTQTMGNLNMTPEFRDQATSFFRFVDNITNRLSDSTVQQPRPSMSESQAVADRFMLLRNASGPESPLEWQRIWDERYKRTFGPLDWTPPTPAAPVLEDGRENPNAYRPYIQRIVDGDSIIVSTAIGAPNPVGMPVEGAQPRTHQVRLLGVNAEEWRQEGGTADKQRLENALRDALRTGASIWLVRDPDTFGSNTDGYGRELAWLWIGDKPFYYEEELFRSVTPSGEGLPEPVEAVQ